MHIPTQVRSLLTILPGSRVVGGCVRDTFIGREPKDWDVATPYLPEEVRDICEAAGYEVIDTGLQHGTVTVVFPDNSFSPVEVTTLRVDATTDGRHAEVQFTDSFEKDAERRDFTFNAMSVDIDGNLYDYFGGMDDLKAGRVRFVGSALERIQEDYLRILRFFRFSARFNFWNVDFNTMAAIKVMAFALKKISKERIASEIEKIARETRTHDAFYQMNILGVSDVIFGHGLYLNPPFFKAARPNNDVDWLVVLKRAEVSLEWFIEYKFSNRVLKSCEILDNISADYVFTSGFSEYWISHEYRKWPEHINSIEYFGELELQIDAPDFPLNGIDMIALGLKGPSIGKKLDNLRYLWCQSHYKLDKEELLKHVGDSINAS